MSVHDGHRERLREVFIKEGGANLPAHNLMELLLFYCIQRRDTNPTAHALLERFGDIRGVLTASCEQLAEVKGIDKASAIMLRLCGELCTRISDRDGDGSTRVHLEGFDDIGLYAVRMFLGTKEEQVHALFLDKNGELVSVLPGYCGDLNSATFSSKRIISMAIQAGATGVVIAHNHPDGLTVPSHEDLTCTRSMVSIFETSGVELVEHIVVAGKRYRRILATALGRDKECPEESEEVDLEGII